MLVIADELPEAFDVLMSVLVLVLVFLFDSPVHSEEEVSDEDLLRLRRFFFDVDASVSELSERFFFSVKEPLQSDSLPSVAFLPELFC